MFLLKQKNISRDPDNLKDDVERLLTRVTSSAPSMEVVDLQESSV